MKSEYRKYSIVMVLCFLLGGFSIIFYITQIYSNFWSHEVFGNTRNESDFRNTSNESEFNRTLGRGPLPIRSEEFLLSPFSLMLLFNGIVLLAGGISLWFITREKEIASAKEKITSLLLQPDERIILNELKKYKGESTQSQLTMKTGMNKVKVHRIIGRLAARGIVKKYNYGMTNKIVLEKDV